MGRGNDESKVRRRLKLGKTSISRRTACIVVLSEAIITLISGRQPGAVFRCCLLMPAAEIRLQQVQETFRQPAGIDEHAEDKYTRLQRNSIETA